MFLPVGRDPHHRRALPIVTWALIAANLLVFVLYQALGSNVRFTYAFAAVPLEIVTGRDVISSGRVLLDPISGHAFHVPGLQPTPIPVRWTLLTSMFMHGGLAHLFGNMLFLSVFGGDLEDALGRARYLFFYLLCGVLAGLAHVVATFVFGQNPLIPALGASGAISAVLGAYFLLFPTRRVHVLAGFFVMAVPAVLVIGLWFVFQVVSGLGMLGRGTQEGGVAYAAHVGGFLAGLLLVHAFRPRARETTGYRPSRPSYA